MRKKSRIGNIWYVIGAILLIGWAVGLFGFHMGSIINVLLIIALVVIILRIFGEKKAF